MLQLYQSSLGEKGDALSSTIELLRMTSVLVTIFNDLRPLRGPDDERLQQLQSVLKWLESWEAAATSKKDMFSYQTQEDLKSMLAGFLQLATKHFSGQCSSSLIPGRINSDVIENFFCQQRTLVNGANTYPTARDYGIGVNALILMQAPMSHKRNSFKAEDANIAAKIIKMENSTKSDKKISTSED